MIARARLSRVLVPAALLLVAGIAVTAVAQDLPPGVSADGSIAVPDVDFRKGWAFLGTFSVAGDEGTTDHHVVYTQPETVDAYRATGRYPDGAVLIKELYQVQTDDLTTGRASWAGDLAGWFVMVKDAKARFPGNPLWGDGWGWAFFAPDNPDMTSTEDYQAECLACHEPVRDQDLSYVQGYPSLRGPSR